jgi:predicted aspartyl protease
MARAHRVPFVPGPPLVVVRAVRNSVGGFLLIIDSGAGHTVISPAAAARLSLDLTQPLRTGLLAGVGQSPPVPIVRLDEVRVGASAVGGLGAAVYALPAAVGADGLLGLNFLRRFRVTLEFDTRTLVLREPPRRPTRPV